MIRLFDQGSLDAVGDLKRCIQLCSTTPVTAHRQMLLRRMFCGGLLISPHPVAAHHSTSSSATLNSRRHCYSRGSPRPEIRCLCHCAGSPFLLVGMCARFLKRSIAGQTGYRLGPARREHGARRVGTLSRTSVAGERNSPPIFSRSPAVNGSAARTTGRLTSSPP